MTGPHERSRYGATPAFSGNRSFLSNFYAGAPFYVPLLDADADTGEHAFNALKTLDPAQRRFVLAADTPGEAKRRGRGGTLRPGWDHGVRVRTMQHVLVSKFTDPGLAGLLAATGMEPLVETNWWHDQFWGSCFCPQHVDRPGINMLGELLMAIRSMKSEPRPTEKTDA